VTKAVGVFIFRAASLSEGKASWVELSPNGWKELGKVTKRIFNGALKRYYVEAEERRHSLHG
jgi:hypothetical protein